MKKIVMLISIISALLAFRNIENNYSNYIVGKVVKAYTQAGFGRGGREWLFMDVKSKDGKVYHIAIAPTFVISNLGINEGDEVKVAGFVPPIFPNGYIKAVNIYDVTQKRDYPIAGFGNCPHYGYGYHYYEGHY